MNMEFLAIMVKFISDLCDRSNQYGYIILLYSFSLLAL